MIAATVVVVFFPLRQSTTQLDGCMSRRADQSHECGAHRKRWMARMLGRCDR